MSAPQAVSGTYRERREREWVLEKTRFPTGSVLSVGFAMAWNGGVWLMAVTVSLGLANSPEPRWLASLLPLAVFSVLIVAGLFLSYDALARLVNRTVVTLSRGALRAQQTPLPGFVGWCVPADGMLGVRAAPVHRTDADGQPFVNWSVQVALDADEVAPVIERLGEEEARFVAAFVAARYAIVDASPPRATPVETRDVHAAR